MAGAVERRASKGIDGEKVGDWGSRSATAIVSSGKLPSPKFDHRVIAVVIFLGLVVSPFIHGHKARTTCNSFVSAVIFLVY